MKQTKLCNTYLTRTFGFFEVDVFNSSRVFEDLNAT